MSFRSIHYYALIFLPVCVLVPLVNGCLAITGLQRTMRLLTCLAGYVSSLRRLLLFCWGDMQHVDRVSGLVCRYLAPRHTCVTRSLISWCMGLCMGVKTELYVGVRRYPEFYAHAWLNFTENHEPKDCHQQAYDQVFQLN